MKKVIIIMTVCLIIIGVLFYPKTQIGLKVCAEPAPCMPVKPNCLGFIEELVTEYSDTLRYKCYGIFY